MKKFIKSRTPLLAIILSLLAVGYTFAANKVVVVPLLGSDSAQWALVDTSQNIIAQSGGISVAQSGTGTVWLNFGRRVVGRPVIVSPQWYGSIGFIKAVICGGSPSQVDSLCDGGKDDGNHVYATTTNSSGITASRAFYIVIP